MGRWSEDLRVLIFDPDPHSCQALAHHEVASRVLSVAGIELAFPIHFGAFEMMETFKMLNRILQQNGLVFLKDFEDRSLNYQTQTVKPVLSPALSFPNLLWAFLYPNHRLFYATCSIYISAGSVAVVLLPPWLDEQKLEVMHLSIITLANSLSWSVGLPE